jgi:hypothetical protein
MAYAAYQVLNGKKVPRTIAAPYFQVTGANVGSYKSYAQRLKRAMKVSFVKKGSGYVLKTKL